MNLCQNLQDHTNPGKTTGKGYIPTVIVFLFKKIFQQESRFICYGYLGYHADTRKNTGRPDLRVVCISLLLSGIPRDHSCTIRIGLTNPLLEKELC